MSDQIVLLGIRAICEKLHLSRSSFKRLRLGTLIASVNGKQIHFPEPTLVIGRSPKWSVESLNKWINI